MTNVKPQYSKLMARNVGAYDYYPFGLELPGRSYTSGPPTHEKFTGHQRDEETGLDYMVARRFDPAFPVFLSVDPHAASYPHLSPYVYAANNPLLYIDPNGKDYVLYFDEEKGTITVLANYYTTESGQASANTAVKFWNDLSGQFIKVGEEFYELKFELRVFALDENKIAEAVADDPAGNMWEIVADGALGYTTQDGQSFMVPGRIESGNSIKVTQSFAADQLVGPHEMGHTLGMTHAGGGVMSESTRLASPSVSITSINQMIIGARSGTPAISINRSGNPVRMGRGRILDPNRPTRR